MAQSLHNLAPGSLINFSGKEWIVLEQMPDGTTYILLNSNDGNRAFDPDNTQIFNPSDGNNIGYYLNNTFYNSLSQKELILEHSWDIRTESGTVKGGKSHVTAKIGLISYSEYNTYRDNVLSQGGTDYIYWTRTPISGNSTNVYSVSTAGVLYNSNASGSLGVRPALYLKSGLGVDDNNNVIENVSPQILNIQLIPTKIWYKDTDDINITATITDEDSNQIQYKVLVNNNQVFPDGENYTQLQPTPANINASINKILFEEKENNLVINVRDEVGGVTEFEYIITKEDINTTQAQRKFDFSNEWHIENTDNVEIKFNEGLKIKEGKIATNYVRTTNYTQINTTGRSTIESVVVDASEDKISEVDIVEDMNFVNNVGEGKVWEYDLRLDRFEDVNKIEVLL